MHRHVVPDLELLLAEPPGVGLPVDWAVLDPDNVDAVAEAAAVLGWSKNWLRQVGLLAASTICLHSGKRVRELSRAPRCCSEMRTACSAATTMATIPAFISLLPGRA